MSLGNHVLKISFFRICPSNQSEGSWRMVAASRSSSIKLFESLLVVYTHPRYSGLMRQPSLIDLGTALNSKGAWL